MHFAGHHFFKNQKQSRNVDERCHCDSPPIVKVLGLDWLGEIINFTNVNCH
jgi:hypothetical protein